MTETNETTANTRPAIFLRAQYIKDLSFENPRAPASLFAVSEQPVMDININLGAQRLDEKVFELAIQLSVRATSEKTTLFLTDLVYAGVIEVQNIADADLEPVLFVQGAALVYPFARRVIADITRDGGFPPVALEPIDFAAMYQTNRQKQAIGEANPAPTQA